MQISHVETTKINELQDAMHQCMYDDNIYTINTIDPYDYVVTEHKRHAEPKAIFQLNLPDHDYVDVHLKTNSGGGPDFIYFIHYDSAPYIDAVIHSMYSLEEKTTRIYLLNVFIPCTYICADNIIIIVSYYKDHIAVHNIETGETRDYYIVSVIAEHISHNDKKIYILKRRRFYEHRVMSVDMVTGIINDDVCTLDTLNNDNILYSMGDILYYVDIALNINICYDMKAERYFTEKHIYDIRSNSHFNKKKTKMYLLSGRHVFQYAVLPDTLFKSTSYNYKDISIKTRDDE